SLRREIWVGEGCGAGARDYFAWGWACCCAPRRCGRRERRRRRAMRKRREVSAGKLSIKRGRRWLERGGQTSAQEVAAGEDGQFRFAGVAAGAFQLTITAEGFAAQTYSGALQAGESSVVPPIALVVATAVTEVRVELTEIEIAQEQMKDEEKQRVLGVIPNFYVTYATNAAPLSSKQKFELAFKSTVDPVTFGIVGGIAGVQQATNHFSGYGQGAEGYAKRYGASYADIIT